MVVTRPRNWLAGLLPFRHVRQVSRRIVVLESGRWSLVGTVVFKSHRPGPFSRPVALGHGSVTRVHE
jgi:hypothetical protein